MGNTDRHELYQLFSETSESTTNVIWTEALSTIDYTILYNNQINARALIGQSNLVYQCAGKPMEKSCGLRIII